MSPLADVRSCASCGARCLWHDEAWVCDDCGDEWYPDHDPVEYADPAEAHAPRWVCPSGHATFGPPEPRGCNECGHDFPPGALGLVIDDGGRAAAGFSVANDAGDCVARAIAIAHELPYREVYDALAERAAAKGGRRSARDGVAPKVYKPYLATLGFQWTPTMSIGSGCTHHLRAGEVPDRGRFVVRLSGHLTALVDGVIHDTYDPSRDGTRCVYGWWEAPRG